jgi:hypothetical protein
MKQEISLHEYSSHHPKLELSDVSFDMVMDVTRSWDKFNRHCGCNFKEMVGISLYLK